MITAFIAAAVLISEPFTMERVVAVVGSEPVLHSDVVTMLIEEGMDQESAAASEQGSDEYTAALEGLVREKLLVEAARRSGVYPTRDEIEDAVDDAMAQARETFSSEAEFTSYLASMGMSVSSLRASYETIMGDRLAGENYIRTRAGRVMSALPLDPAAYFQEHPESVESVLAPRELSWIYLPVLPGGALDEEVLLSQLKTAIEAGETTFSAAAVQYSQDGSASMGGDLGWFGPGDMTATFETQVYALEPGEIAGPFRTPFGIHLVKLTDVDGERVRASHILRMVSPTQADLDSTFARAWNLRELAMSGADFSDLAREYSADPETEATGGYIGTVNTGNWDGALREAVIRLQPGDISEPVALEQGMAVAVFRRDQETGIDWGSFEDDELQAMLQSVVWNSYYDEMVDSLASEIPVRINTGDGDAD
ncbi:MAG TPA: peptidylprolyl isomerase [Candidatus Sabulitectum sp.]|nr:peptidylprolyl isomerase [Candidatus Sabulitectum sp.]HPJ28417.1 peptidylprolyl isomerase [Candidatus Sabulitectum sp.]HPR22045.1 peptidylprolyl isomerase [Candidatus Sabulitectum sp.]